MEIGDDATAHKSAMADLFELQNGDSEVRKEILGENYGDKLSLMVEVLEQDLDKARSDLGLWMPDCLSYFLARQLDRSVSRDYSSALNFPSSREHTSSFFFSIGISFLPLPLESHLWVCVALTPAARV
jgi:hypothetical protein